MGESRPRDSERPPAGRSAGRVAHEPHSNEVHAVVLESKAVRSYSNFGFGGMAKKRSSHILSFHVETVSVLLSASRSRCAT